MKAFIASIATIIAGIIGAFLEPLSFSISLPIAVMGAFILHAIEKLSPPDPPEQPQDSQESSDQPQDPPAF